MKNRVLNLIGLTSLGFMTSFASFGAKVYEPEYNLSKDCFEKFISKSFSVAEKKEKFASKEIYDLSKPVDIKIEKTEKKQEQFEENSFKYYPRPFTKDLIKIQEVGASR